MESITIVVVTILRWTSAVGATDFKFSFGSAITIDTTVIGTIGITVTASTITIPNSLHHKRDFFPRFRLPDATCRHNESRDDDRQFLLRDIAGNLESRDAKNATSRVRC